MTKLIESDLEKAKKLKNERGIELEQISVPTRKHYAKIFKEASNRSKAISLGLQEKDYIRIKAKAMEFGMPYQSLINSIIHRFLTGNLDFKVTSIKNHHAK